MNTFNEFSIQLTNFKTETKMYKIVIEKNKFRR